MRRYGEAEFGNRSPTWDTLELFYTSDAWRNPYPIPTSSERLFHLRNRVAGGPTQYNVGLFHFDWNLGAMLQEGVKESDIYVSEMCPTHLTQVQGEVMRRWDGLYLYYSSVKKPMRDSLREGGREAKGLVAKTILEHYMDVNSYEWLNLLLDRYPDHVVEFTTLSREWGCIPGYNSLFWEVRMY